MLIAPSRRARDGERGQTLVMALAFIVFFGVVAVAVLRVAEVPGLQHVRTEATASNDAYAEGGAALAAADASRSDLSLTCAVNNTAQVTMQSTDTAKYTVNQCNPGLTGGGSPGTGPGANCILCILNLNPSPTNPTSAVLSTQCGHCSGPDLATSGGDIYVNGSIGNHSVITATASTGSAHIRVLSGGSGALCTCSPAVTFFAPALTDTFSPGAPATVAGRPTGCLVYSSSDGCTAAFAGATATIHPGLWASLAISGAANVTMASGVYVFTGPLSLSGTASLTGSDVVIYLTCPGYGPAGTRCASGHTGASLSFGGGGGSSPGATLSAPTSGQYAGFGVVADPGLIDPHTSCSNGGSGTCLMETSGNGASVSGSVDLHGGGMSIQGNGATTIGGRLIVNTLSLSVSGHVGSGLSLSGSIPGVSTSACGVFDTTVSGAAGSNVSMGRAIVQSQCGNGSLNGVVAFNYKQ